MSALHPPSTAAGPVRFGVNYTPRQGWFHSWLDLDLDAVGEDLAAIASLGADHVRLFPLWPLLQPNRTLIRPRALEDVRAVVDVAAAAGLDAVFDVLQGHLSSFDFVPSWLTSWHRRNMFTDPEVVAATAQLVREVARSVADASNLLGLTLGNEVNQFSASNHPDPDPLEVGQAEAWTRTLLEAAREGAPEGMHTVANYDAAWFIDDHAFTPDQSAASGTRRSSTPGSSTAPDSAAAPAPTRSPTGPSTTSSSPAASPPSPNAHCGCRRSGRPAASSRSRTCPASWTPRCATPRSARGCGA